MSRTSTMGGSGGQPFISNCPPGEYITQWYGKSGSVMDRFGARHALMVLILAHMAAVEEVKANDGLVR